MQMSLPPWPDGVADVVRDHAPQLIGEDAFAGRAEPTIGQPWPLYVTAVEHLVAGRLIAASRHAAWQCAIYADQIVLGLSEVDVQPRRFTAFYPPAYVTPILQAIALAEQRDATIPTATYQLRILRVSTVNLVSVWMQGPDNVFFPVTPRFPNFGPPKAVMNEDEIVDWLRTFAQDRMAATGDLGA